MMAEQHSATTAQHFQFHSFDIKLHQIQTVDFKRIQIHRSHSGAGASLVGNVLSYEFIAGPLAQFQTAEARRQKVVRLRHGQFTAILTESGKSRARVQTVVQCDIAGQCVKYNFLGLIGGYLSPSPHVPRPLYGVHANVRAAVDCHHAITKMPATTVEQSQCKTHFLFIKT